MRVVDQVIKSSILTVASSKGSISLLGSRQISLSSRLPVRYAMVFILIRSANTNVQSDTQRYQWHILPDTTRSLFSSVIRGGHSLQWRWFSISRFRAEKKARRALLGKYRNPYTDNEMVKGIIRTASNTNVIFWRGVLLAMKEDGPPFALDPVTLETIGRYDFDGQVSSPTFTAHPKFDPDTGEMVCYGYEAGGNGYDASCDIVVYTIDKDGKKTEECWYKAPFCGMIHDCAITKNYLILPLTPIKANHDRLKRGGNHFAWDPKEDQWYGIVPRRHGKPEDIVWLRADNGTLFTLVLESDS
jgi:carotenoid cleavage dioxygenase-like enzyme